MLLKLVEAGKIDPSSLITHSTSRTSIPLRDDLANARTLVEFRFEDIEGAYQVFGAAAQNEATKVVIEMDGK